MQAILEHGNLPPEEAEKFVALLSSEFAELRGNAATKEDFTVLSGEVREVREVIARVEAEMREGFAEVRVDAAERHAAILEHFGRLGRNDPIRTRRDARGHARSATA